MAVIVMVSSSIAIIVIVSRIITHFPAAYQAVSKMKCHVKMQSSPHFLFINTHLALAIVPVEYEIFNTKGCAMTYYNFR